MSGKNIETVIKILESLPDSQQESIIEHLQEYIADCQDEWQWNKAFQNKQSKLVEVAKQARQQIAQGQATPMKYDQL